MFETNDETFPERMMKKLRDERRPVLFSWLYGNIRDVFKVKITVYIVEERREILSLDIERLCDFSIMWYTLLLFKNSFFFLSLYKPQ